MEKTKYLILGAGFSGLSTSYHIGHGKCLVLEKTPDLYGHCKSKYRDEYYWDEGPHVSFSNIEYIKKLFSESVKHQYAEYEVKVGNYYKGSWIDHPAQVNLYQVPEPLRSECIKSFKISNTLENIEVDNYSQWLDAAFGEVFARSFPAAYTRKYWTCEPIDLEVSWVGRRVHRPKESDVIKGAIGPLNKQTHYIKKVRYPREGGYESFGSIMADKSNVKNDHEVVKIDLDKKIVSCSNGRKFSYEVLVSTIPLPVFVSACEQRTPLVSKEVDKLKCTSGYLVNVVVPHKAIRDENWLYVYDENFISTRITYADKLDGKEKNNCLLQVEVYESDYRKLNLSEKEIVETVVTELRDMELIQDDFITGDNKIKSHLTKFKWGNVIFNHERKCALDKILNWLAGYGLIREEGDLDAMADWESEIEKKIGNVILAGRFSQWNYYWSDDCVMRGKEISEMIDGIS